MKKILISLVAIVLAVSGYFGYQYLSKSDEQKMLEKYDLDGLTVVEIVNTLDQQSNELESLNASITPDTLILMDGDKDYSFDLPEDQFYVSFAPYINQTHPCTQHNLVYCQSELTNQVIRVLITQTDGTVLIDQDYTTMANGFVGLWLPKNIDASLQINYQDLSVTIPLTTNPDSDTCITTPLQLS